MKKDLYYTYKFLNYKLCTFLFYRPRHAVKSNNYVVTRIYNE